MSGSLRAQPVSPTLLLPVRLPGVSSPHGYPTGRNHGCRIPSLPAQWFDRRRVFVHLGDIAEDWETLVLARGTVRLIRWWEAQSLTPVYSAHQAEAFNSIAFRNLRYGTRREDVTFPLGFVTTHERYNQEDIGNRLPLFPCSSISFIPRTMLLPKVAHDDMSSQKSGPDVQLHPVDPLHSQPSPPKDAKFWLVFLAICITLVLSALDFVSERPPLWHSYLVLITTRLLFRQRCLLSCMTSMEKTLFGFLLPMRWQPLHSCLLPVQWHRRVSLFYRFLLRSSSGTPRCLAGAQQSWDPLDYLRWARSFVLLPRI